MESHVRKSLDWWLRGQSPQEHRLDRDDVDAAYLRINRHCESPGRILNEKWRNYFYSNYDVLNLEDLRGWFYEPEFYDTYNVNLVITPNRGPKADEMAKYSQVTPWFHENFVRIFVAEDITLWRRTSYTGCTLPFPEDSGSANN